MTDRLEGKARAIFGNTELWRTGHPLHRKMMLRRAALAAAARQGGEKKAEKPDERG